MLRHWIGVLRERWIGGRRVVAVADVSVRPARLDDVPEIARIQRDTLSLAYEAVLPASMFAELADPSVQLAIAAALRAQIERPRPDEHALVAMEGAQIVGIAFARAAVIDGDSELEAGDPDPDRTGFLEQILVEPRWGRRGHGSRLLAAAMEQFSQAGYRRAVTWVAEGNAATLNFLTPAGWERDGYVRGLDTGAGPALREFRMHTSLAD